MQTPREKFTSELDISIPSDRKEMVRRAIGSEDGVPNHPLSEWSLRNGKTSHAHTVAHLAAVEKSEGKASRDAELARIQSLQRAGGVKVFNER